MSFERKFLRVVLPLDHAKGVCYTEPVHNYEESEDELDQIYKIIAQDHDWINPMMDGWIA